MVFTYDTCKEAKYNRDQGSAWGLELIFIPLPEKLLDPQEIPNIAYIRKH